MNTENSKTSEQHRFKLNLTDKINLKNPIKTQQKQNFPKFVTKKWIEVYDQSGRNYNVNKKIRIKT